MLSEDLEQCNSGLKVLPILSDLKSLNNATRAIKASLCYEKILNNAIQVIEDSPCYQKILNSASQAFKGLPLPSDDLEQRSRLRKLCELGLEGARPSKP